MEGWTAPGWEPVGDAFQTVLDGTPAQGAAVAVHLDGAPVVDLWGGVADSSTGRPWQQRTPGLVFSCTKGMLALLVAQLVDSGRLSYDDRVADHWPEFANAGKVAVRVGDLLAHRAGLPAFDRAIAFAELGRDRELAAELAAQTPRWEASAGYLYHPITWGWLVGELLWRVTGQDPRRLIADKLTAPLRADVWLGVPSDISSDVAVVEVDATARTAPTVAPPAIVADAMTLGGALPESLAGAPGLPGLDDPAAQALGVPGAGAVATARGLAAVWAATVGSVDGVRVISDAARDEMVRERSSGPSVLGLPGPWPRFGAGVQLTSDAQPYLSPSSFGHDGAGGQMAFADPGARLGFGFITNLMGGAGDQRAASLVRAVQRVLER